MLSDLDKHNETRRLTEGPFGMLALAEMLHGTPDSIRRFIEGFN